MKNLFFFIFVGVVCSYKNTQNQEIKKEEAKKLSKLEILYMLPKDSIYEFYDLSNDSIKEFPDLSEYSIKKLDLSRNMIQKMEYKKMPKSIVELNLSHNFFLKSFFLSNKTPKTLKNLNLSYNNISSYNTVISLKRLAINNNTLESISLGNEKMDFLDISNNPNLSNEMFFDPKYVDTIIHNNIANNKPLVFYFNKSFIIE